MPYYVSYAACTDFEPSPGWYYSAEDEDGTETIHGPFHSKAEALDAESDGAYSEYLADRRDAERYEDDLRAAGRGHLLRR